MKRFFKPTKGKIIITLFLALILESYFYLLGASSILCEACRPGEICGHCFASELGIQAALITLLPVLIFSYLISCSIVSLFKNKKI